MERRRLGLIAAVIGGATALGLAMRPRSPTMDVVGVKLTGFRLRFQAPSPLPLLDVDLLLIVHVTNPNVVAVRYFPSKVAISYRGSSLGEAHVCAGEQRRNSCGMLRLPGSLYGLEIANHLAEIAADVFRREMDIAASVRVRGSADLLWWAHRFAVDFRSRLKLDPLLLDVIEQDNSSRLLLTLCP